MFLFFYLFIIILLLILPQKAEWIFIKNIVFHEMRHTPKCRKDNLTTFDRPFTTTPASHSPSTNQKDTITTATTTTATKQQQQHNHNQDRPKRSIVNVITCRTSFTIKFNPYFLISYEFSLKKLISTSSQQKEFCRQRR